jgi:hypothetical protein
LVGSLTESAIHNGRRPARQNAIVIQVHAGGERSASKISFEVLGNEASGLGLADGACQQ